MRPRQLADSVDIYSGSVAQTKGIRCTRPSYGRGTSFSPSMGSCGGEPPGGDGGTRNGGTGAIFQGTVTGRGALRHLSRAARSRALLGTNPAHLRRTGMPIHPTEGSSAAREGRVRGALNGLAPSASSIACALRAVW